MKLFNYDIEIISAPSILGLKPTGEESLGKSLFDSGLVEKLRCTHSVIHVPTDKDGHISKNIATSPGLAFSWGITKAF